ncbi:MAG: DUF4834 family protein [Prevotella sp.]|uniref:DUF4834 family protein n=1 Tax=Segatella oulorum TaxID=28136 RepID=UPI000F1FCA01|nr:DUF4834 family protein [Segatella oulorum]RKW51946.1 MAG: DUF4834 family protein [Prevotella sp.]
MAFLKFIFVLFIVLFVFVLFTALRFLNTFRQNINRFRRTMNGANAQQRTNYGNREGVIDTRDPEEAQKKIFKKDEGEYVDYEEEK